MIVKICEQCPKCGSHNTDYEDCDGENMEDILSYMKCNDCGAEWTDHYYATYSGYTYKGKEYDEYGELLVKEIEE